MADIVFIAILILHIGFIVTWFGGAALFSMIIAPSLAKIAPAARAEFVIATLPRYIRFIAGSATGAIIFGVLLFGYISRSTTLAPSSSGLPLIEAGAVLGLLAYIIAMGVVYPTANKLVKTMKQMSSSTGAAGQSESAIAQMQQRMRIGASAAAGILGLTLILMIVGASV
ncbi:MAG TPA: hypothetical protein VN739_04290 [Nitrososphaerales archaeon]|nr:hypothetical protein [Nitrososphaerales archaeon]